MSNALSTRPAPRKPATIVLAFWALITSAALTVAATVLSVVDVTSASGEAALEDSITRTSGALDGELDLETLVAISQTTAVALQVLFAVLSLGLVLWIAFTLRAGRRYIRIVASVLVVLQALTTVAAASPISVASLVVVVVAVVASWMPPSERYLAECALRRRDAREFAGAGAR